MATATDVLGMLRRHYLQDNRPPGGIFAPEVQSPCGKRRADLLWLPLTASAARGLVGHEIKVSRTDLISELRDPTKPDPWLRYCSAWWLVVADPRLVDGLDIPETWGVMAPPSGRLRRSMTVLQRPVRLEPEERSAGIERVTAWLFWQQHEQLAALRRELAHAERMRESAERRETELRATGTGYVTPERLRISGIVQQVEAALRATGVYSNADDTDIAQAIADLTVARRAREEIVREIELMMGDVKTLTEPFRSTYGALAQVLADHNTEGKGRS